MVAAALALGAATAFFHLGAHSLWFDEITGARVATLRTVADVTAARDMDSHPPATALTEHFSVKVFGLTEWALRLPAALASVLALAAIVGIAAGLGDKRVGWLAAALAALSPTFVTFAQDARPYALGMLFSAGATMCFLFGFRGGRKYVWFPLYAAFAALAFYSHYFTTIVIATHVGVAFLAWLPAFRPANARSARAYLLIFGCFLLALGAAFAVNFSVFEKALFDRARFPGGEMSLSPTLVWGAFASGGWNRAAANALFLAAAAAGGGFLWRRYGAFVGVVALAVSLVPLLAPPFAIRLTTQFWHPRFSYFGFPGFIVLSAFGFVAIARAAAADIGKKLGATALALVLALGAAKALCDNGTALQVLYNNEHQDFRTAVAICNANRFRGTRILVYPYRNWNCYEFYTRTQGGPVADASPRPAIVKAFESAPRVFLVSTETEFNTELLEKFPTTVSFRVARLDILYHDNYYTTVDDALKNVPHDVMGMPPGVTYDALAKLAMRSGKTERAAGYFTLSLAQAGELNADVIPAAMAYRAMGQTEKTRRLLTGYIRRHPDEPWPFTLLGELYIKNKDKTTAVACFRRAVWLEPSKRGWSDRLKDLRGQLKFWPAALGFIDPRWL
jgi:tetratricopeptide (TPR) repeat protein